MIIQTHKKDKARRMGVLCRHFFMQNFQSDLIVFPEQQTAKIITSIIILAMASALISFSMLFPEYFWTLDSPETWKYKYNFLSILMLVFAVLSILQWENQFLGQGDYNNLSHLPISKWNILLSKICATSFFISIYCLGAAILSGIVFAVMLTHLQASFIFSARYFLAHCISIFAACMFIHYFCSLIQLLLLIVLPITWIKKAGAYIQFVLILLSLTYFSSAGFSLNIVSEWFNKSDCRAFAFPSLWFTGMYQWGIGQYTSFNSRLAIFGAVSLILLLGVHSFMVFIRYSQHFHGRNVKNEVIAPITTISAYLKKIIFGNQHERAIYDFMTASIKRSGMHRLRMSGVLAMGTAFAAILFSKGFSLGSRPLGIILILAPLHVIFIFCLAGVRAIMDIPLELEANWIFRITAHDPLKKYRSANIKLISLRFMLPISIIGIVIYWISNGLYFAISHVLFTFLTTQVIIQIIFQKINKIPFTCSFLSGKMNLKVYVGPILLVFIMYMALVTILEYICFSSSIAMVTGIVLLVAVDCLLIKILGKNNGELQYIEEPMPVMLSIIDESLM